MSDNTNPAVLNVLSPNKYVTVPKSQDLITHGWAKRTDGNNYTFRYLKKVTGQT